MHRASLVSHDDPNYFDVPLDLASSDEASDLEIKYNDYQSNNFLTWFYPGQGLQPGFLVNGFVTVIPKGYGHNHRIGDSIRINSLTLRWAVAPGIKQRFIGYSYRIIAVIDYGSNGNSPVGLSAIYSLPSSPSLPNTNAFFNPTQAQRYEVLYDRTFDVPCTNLPTGNVFPYPDDQLYPIDTQTGSAYIPLDLPVEYNKNADNSYISLVSGSILVFAIANAPLTDYLGGGEVAGNQVEIGGAPATGHRIYCNARVTYTDE